MMPALAAHRRSNRHRQPTVARPTPSPRRQARLAARWSALIIRMAVNADEKPLRRLAHLDSSRPLSGRALLAEQDGALIAALSLEDGAVIADPFRPSADAVTMLRVRAAQLRRSAAAAA